MANTLPLIRGVTLVHNSTISNVIPAHAGIASFSKILLVHEPPLNLPLSKGETCIAKKMNQSLRMSLPGRGRTGIASE